MLTLQERSDTEDLSRRVVVHAVLAVGGFALAATDAGGVGHVGEVQVHAVARVREEAVDEGDVGYVLLVVERKVGTW